MAIQDSTSFLAALREGWTQDTIEDQIYQGNPALEAFERMTPAIEVGNTARTPVHTGRGGGFSMVPRTGSAALNAADNEETNQATWNYAHAWQQVQIETAVVDESSKNSLAVAQAVDYEMSSKVENLRKQITRQIFGNGDSLIAQCTTTSGSATVNLLSTGLGNQAIVRTWLYPGQQIDIGTTGNETLRVADAVIQSVSESTSAPTITIDSSITTASTDFVSIANARSGATSYETNGLQNIVSLTASLGGISPATVPGWKAAGVDTTAQALGLPVLYKQQRNIFQRTGNDPTWALTSPAQREALYIALQSQVRFAGDGNLGAGKVQQLMLGNTAVEAQPDCPDPFFYFLTKEKLMSIRTQKPEWASKKYGGGNELEWQQGTTRLVGALVYRFQIGTNRRNAHSALTALSGT